MVSDTLRPIIQGDFDVAEVGLTYFLRTCDLDDAAFLALPIFPNRNFRHSAIFVNAAAGIAVQHAKPDDISEIGTASAARKLIGAAGAESGSRRSEVLLTAISQVLS